jgi:hypothetical protein
VPKVEICSDYVLTFSAYKTEGKSKRQVIANLTDKEWLELQRVEEEYLRWQEKLNSLDREFIRKRVSSDARKVTAKAARIKDR